MDTLREEIPVRIEVKIWNQQLHKQRSQTFQNQYEVETMESTHMKVRWRADVGNNWLEIKITVLSDVDELDLCHGLPEEQMKQQSQWELELQSDCSRS